MTIQSRQYLSIQGIPQYLDQEHQKQFMQQWQIFHSEDHQNFFALLENLENQLSLPSYEMNYFNI